MRHSTAFLTGCVLTCQLGVLKKNKLDEVVKKGAQMNEFK